MLLPLPLLLRPPPLTPPSRAAAIDDSGSGVLCEADLKFGLQEFEPGAYNAREITALYVNYRRIYAVNSLRNPCC